MMDWIQADKNNTGYIIQYTTISENDWTLEVSFEALRRSLPKMLAKHTSACHKGVQICRTQMLCYNLMDISTEGHTEDHNL
jgi:hypothetical protein